WTAYLYPRRHKLRVRQLATPHRAQAIRRHRLPTPRLGHSQPILTRPPTKLANSCKNDTILPRCKPLVFRKSRVTPTPRQPSVSMYDGEPLCLLMTNPRSLR